LNRSETFPEGTFDCIGVKGQPTSRHYNLIVEDDTVAPDFDELGQEMLAPTHEDVQKAIAWHRLCTPLLTNPKDDEIMVVGTRWYEHDLISHIQEKETHYKVIERSCRENAQGESDPRGEVTYPERFDAQTLHEIEQSLGPYFYSTLMLNRPISVGNMVFKPEWIRYYEQLPPRRSLHVYTTVDCATDPELSTTRPDKLDYSTVLTAGKDVLSGDIYVLEYFRARCSPGEHTAAIFDHVQRWNPIKVGYEDIAYQKSLDYWLKDLMRQHQKFFILEAVKRQGRKSKETHIMGLQPIFASGSILIRRHHKELESELLTFPRGQHDDLLDTLAMQTPMWAMTRKAQSKNHPNLQYLNTIEAAIESIRNRQRYANHQDSIIHDPFRCSSSWN
jgi:predicted phage terminase large subunit-like protein